MPKVTGCQASKLRLNSDLSDPRADGQTHGMSLLLSRGSTSSCWKTEARAGTSLAAVSFLLLCLWRSQPSTLHCPFLGTSDPCSSWYGTVPGLSIWSTTPAGLADQLKILLLFLLILLSFLLKRVQSFPPHLCRS